MSVKKTNAMRLLDAAKVPYETKEYEFDLDDLSGTHAAEALGLDADMVFKTLVAVGDKTGPTVFVIPVALALDLKRAAAVSGNKRVEMLPLKELTNVTGYLRGGCSPIGMKKRFPTFVDHRAEARKIVSVSAGLRGVQVLVEPRALAAFVGGTFADLAD
jgi:Cys-tRNA(Pro)/Cys-tRNA(Cys) deacylase